VLAKKQVLVITKWGLLATTIWLGLVGLEIVRFAGISVHQSADAAIVLGAAVVDNRPSLVFQARIDHAIDLWKTQRIKYLIFTGGLGSGDTLTESQVAKEYAVSQGVPPDQIFIELKSRTTKQNLLEAQKILQAQQLSSCLLVSDPHLLSIPAIKLGNHSYRFWCGKCIFIIIIGCFSNDGYYSCYFIVG
jgi:uncharacterized SAM-binding protein YcdF (DUF218 family)